MYVDITTFLTLPIGNVKNVGIENFLTRKTTLET